MVVDISAFRGAAELSSSRLALGKQDNVVSGSSGPQHIFSWCRTSSSEKNANRELAQAFRQALVNEFGERNIADAFSKSISLRSIHKGSAVSSQQIKAVLNNVDTLRAEANQAMLRKSIVPGLSDAAYAASNLDNRLAFSRLSFMGQTVLNLTREALADTVDLISDLPVTPEGLEGFKQNAAKLRQDLTKLMDEAQTLPDASVAAEVQWEITSALGDIAAKTAELERLGMHRPLNQENVSHARGQWYAAALLCLDKNLDALTGSIPSQYTAPLLEAKVALLQARDDDALRFQDPRADVSHPEKELKGLSKKLGDALHKAFGGRLDRKVIQEKLQLSWKEIINKHQDWKPISRDIPLVLDGRRLTPTSTVTPAAGFGNIFTASYDGKGVGCYSFTESEHAMNLAASNLTLDDGHGGKRTLFKGLRHGVHYAADIKNREQREAANLNRATETVKAALVNSPALLRQALEAGPDAPPISIPITSVALLTPDKLRNTGLFNFFKNRARNNERQMLQEQKLAWDTLSKGPLTLTVLDAAGNEKNVTVQPQVTTFNFGVNAGPMKHQHMPNWAGGWDASDKLNTMAMTQLELRVDQFLAAERPAKDKELVRQLFEQVQNIWQTDSYKKPGNEPYKMVSRIVVLTHMLGDTACWNCKSGKDRTGNTDVEARFLALRIAVSGKVPEPDALLTGEERAALRAFALASGNLELQALNTGLQGFKLEGVSANDERLGELDARKYFRGGSTFTSA